MALLFPRFQLRRAALTAVVLAGAFYCLTQYIDMTSLPKSGLLAILTASSGAVTQAVDPKWYPPSSNQINNLTGVLRGEGIYGFIYNTSHTPDETYGIYNWCNMPHARKREYAKPSDEHELIYVEVVSQNCAFSQLSCLV